MSGYYSDSHVHGPETDTPPVLGSDLFVKKKFMRIFVKVLISPKLLCRNCFAKLWCRIFIVNVRVMLHNLKFDQDFVALL